MRRVVRRVPRPRSDPSRLARAIAELKAEARAARFSDADIEAEIAAYNAERSADNIFETSSFNVIDRMGNGNLFSLLQQSCSQQTDEHWNDKQK